MELFRICVFLAAVIVVAHSQGNDTAPSVNGTTNDDVSDTATQIAVSDDETVAVDDTVVTVGEVVPQVTEASQAGAQTQESPTSQPDVVTQGDQGSVVTQANQQSEIVTQETEESKVTQESRVTQAELEEKTTVANQNSVAAEEIQETQESPTVQTSEEVPVVPIEVESKEDTKDSDRRVIKVAGIEAQLYLFEDPAASDNTTGNDRYTGFIKELLDALTLEMDVDYELNPELNGYGRLENGKWTGVIGEVAEGRADVAAGPLTITLEREKAIDFTYPFQTFQAMIIMRKRDPDMKPKIESLDDLLNQDTVKYAVTKDSAIHRFLKESNKDVHKEMLKTIESDTVLSLRDNNNDGVGRARVDSNFAFIMEGSTAEYVLNQPPCNLVGIPAGFYQRQYALAVEQRGALREELNDAMGMIEYKSGLLSELRKKWLSGSDGCASGVSSPHVSYIIWLVVTFLVSIIALNR